MVYKVIGIMSGSSLDGLDIAYVQLDEVRGKWQFELLASTCVPYDAAMQQTLKTATQADVPTFLRLHTSFGKYIGTQINAFIEANALEHKVHFIASHGHTVWHEPAAQTTCQIGDGAAICATVGLPVISDLRAMDVAMGGQGAPIVPIGDELLFGSFDYLLNIGGIANVTLKSEQTYSAFDVCVANQVLNGLAQSMGLAMDEGGAIAASGQVVPALLAQLNELPYYQVSGPKSLSNEQAMGMVWPLMQQSTANTADKLCTMVAHICQQIAAAIDNDGSVAKKMLVTGGGAHNAYLISQLVLQMAQKNVEVTVPSPGVINFKEAIVMALIGTLRWREEVNVLNSVTGARDSSVGGALWITQG